MYQEIILDHYRHPHRKGLREPFDAEVHHINPTCGDEVTLRVTLKDAGSEPAVADVSYDALGCSISQASVSVMADMMIGKPVSEAMEISDEFLELMQSRGEAEPDEDVLGDAVVFEGVAKYPARIKCALLGWMAWKDATAGTGTAATEQALAELEQSRMTHKRPSTAERRHRSADTATSLRSRTCSRRSGRRRPRARRQRRRPRPGLRRHHGRGPGRHHRHDADKRGLPADRRDRGPDPGRRSTGWSATSGSTGSGCRRGDRRRSPRTAASSCGHWASTSELAARPPAGMTFAP